MSKMSKTPVTPPTPADVQAALQMSTLPDDEFMALLAELGDGPFVDGPALDDSARAYTPEELEEIVINGTVGDLVATMRQESHCTLEEVGSRAGVTRARIQQIEQSSNIQVATLVRLAGAMGYRVGISLRPMDSSRRLLTAELEPALGATAA